MTRDEDFLCRNGRRCCCNAVHRRTDRPSGFTACWRGWACGRGCCGWWAHLGRPKHGSAAPRFTCHSPWHERATGSAIANTRSCRSPPDLQHRPTDTLWLCHSSCRPMAARKASGLKAGTAAGAACSQNAKCSQVHDDLRDMQASKVCNRPAPEGKHPANSSQQQFWMINVAT